MEEDINNDKTEATFSSSGNEDTVGLTRNDSASLHPMVKPENITDVIVTSDDVIISQNVMMNGTEISHSSEETLSINEECISTKRDSIELDSSPLAVSPRTSFGPKFSRKSRNNLSEDWKEAAEQPVLHVHCRKITGQLHKSRFGSGAKGKSIQVGKVFFTPSQFEAHCGRSASKDWKRSIRFKGQTLQTLIDEGFIEVHAPSCSCAICLEDTLAAGPVRLYQQCKRRRRSRNVESNTVFKECAADEPFPACQTTTIALPVPALNELSNPGSPVHPLPSITLDLSGLENVSNLSLDKAWDQMSQTLENLEKGVSKTREMLEVLRQRANTELEEQRRLLLQEKEEAIQQTKLEAHLTSVNRTSENEFLVEVRSSTQPNVEEEEEEEHSSTIHPVMLDSLAAPMPSLCSAHIKKKCVNCNRDSSSECSCRRKSYCSAFCQRRDWVSHRDECTALRSSPAREVPGYIFMLSE